MEQEGVDAARTPQGQEHSQYRSGLMPNLPFLIYNGILQRLERILQEVYERREDHSYPEVLLDEEHNTRHVDGADRRSDSRERDS